MILYRACMLVLPLIVAGCGAPPARDDRGTIFGHVYMGSLQNNGFVGEEIRGVNVVVTAITGEVFSTTTDDSGYRLSGLPIGPAIVKVVDDGWSEYPICRVLLGETNPSGVVVRSGIAVNAGNDNYAPRPCPRPSVTPTPFSVAPN